MKHLTVSLLPVLFAQCCLAQPHSGKMTEGERLRVYLRQVASPAAMASSAAGAGIGEWREKPEEWKQDPEGYGLRYASSYAQHVTRETILFGASSLLHEDYRYTRSGQPGIGSRIKHAVGSTFLSRREDGSRRISWSRLGAVAAASMISRLWQPESNRSVRSGMINLGTSIGTAAGFNVAREFWFRK